MTSDALNIPPPILLTNQLLENPFHLLQKKKKKVYFLSELIFQGNQVKGP